MARLGVKRTRAAAKGKRKAARRLLQGDARSRAIVSRRGGYARATTMVLPRTLGFPNRMRAKLRYSENGLQIAAGTAGFAGTYYFRCNSLYDPNNTGLGHQPLAFDEYANLYTHYRVLSARITCTFFNESTAQNMIVGIARRRDNGSVTDLNRIIEGGDVVYDHVTVETGGQGTKTLSLAIDPARWLGIPSNDIDRLEALFTTNPDEQCYFCLFYACSDPNITPSGILANVTMDFDCVFREKKLLASS